MTECRCSREINDDAYVCRVCVSEATKDLTEVAYFLHHVDEKRALYGSNWRHGTIGRSPETPLPYDPRVRKTLTPIRNALTTWARVHADEHPDHPTPPVELEPLAKWLSEFTEWVAGKPWSHDAFTQYQDAHAALRKLFDNPPDREAIGECGAVHDDGSVCTEVLAAEKGASTHSCPRCGAQHDVRERRNALIDQAADLTVTIAEAVKMLRTTDRHRVDARLIRALVRYVPINDSGTRPELDIKGRVQHASVYPLGAIRDAIDTFESDREVQREVKRVMNGRPLRHAS